MCADGSKNKITHNSEFNGIQVTGEMNNYMYDLLNISGNYVTNTKDVTDQITNFGKRTKQTIIYQTYSDCGDRNWKVTNIEDYKLNSKAEVWCLEVETDHSFLLENGIPTGNCMLFDIETVLNGGFEMGNIWYNEPKRLSSVFGVIGDIILCTASQQYGGFTLCEIDKVLSKYAEKSFDKYKQKYMAIGLKQLESCTLALADVKNDFKQGFQEGIQT